MSAYMRSKVSINGKRQSAPLTMWRRINEKEKLAIATINISSTYTEVWIPSIV